MQQQTSIKAIKVIAPFIIADVAFFCTFNPTDSNSFITIIGCILLALTLYAVAKMFFILLSGVIPFSAIVQKRLSLSFAVLLTFLILMQSIGQLGIRDVLAVIPLVFVSYFYLSYLRKRTNTSSETNPH